MHYDHFLNQKQQLVHGVIYYFAVLKIKMQCKVLSEQQGYKLPILEAPDFHGRKKNPDKTSCWVIFPENLILHNL